MANGQGGARIGAGRKKKALADNIADGNPGKRKLTVLDFTDNAADLEGQQMPPPKAFLAAKQKNGKDLLAVQVYEETWRWLAERECARLVPAQILEQYAMAISRWIQCEECITEYGFLAKHPTTGNAIPSPYVAMSQSFSKQANNLWYVWLFKVRAKPVTETYATKEGTSITRQTGEVEWTAIKRTSDGRYQAVADEGENGFTAEKAAAFLNTVYTPVFTTSK